MYLVELHIENVRAIRHVALSFRGHSPQERTRRWTVLLGENGCGKSTVLKSIGLLLAGSEALPDLLGVPDQWIHNSAQQARLSATIETADGKERTVSLVLNRGDGRDGVIKRNSKGLHSLDAAIKQADRNYFIAGYGAFRRPPDLTRRSGHYSERGRAAQLATMFSLSQDLVSLEQWAMDVDYASGTEGRSVIAEALAKLLPGMTFKDIDKKTRSVVMSTQDGDVQMRQLSEGYQAMAAWAGDLLFRMTETFRDRKDPLAARGVLLIDEMDLHLHPVWKRNLVDFLNSAFPNLQIVATTHSPLSIQQCGEGELFVVRREAGGPVLVPFKGDPSNLRLSELFLSPLIGLDTLDSPKVAALREQAREIELRPGEKSKTDVEQLRSIQEKLEGTTPLLPEEAPAFAQLIAYQKTVELPDVAARVLEAESLFGTARSAMPPAEPRSRTQSNATPKSTTARRAAKKQPAKKIATPSLASRTPRKKISVPKTKPAAKRMAAPPTKTTPTSKTVSATKPKGSPKPPAKKTAPRKA